MPSFGPRTSQRRSTKRSHICAVKGITLNPEKFHFAEDTVEFAGFSIGGQVPPIDHGVPHTHQHHRYQVMVWPGKSGGIHICHDGHDATVPSPPQASHIDRSAGRGVPILQTTYLRPDKDRCRNLRQEQTHMFDHGLVQGGHRLLAHAETLPLPLQRTILLPRESRSSAPG